MHLAQVMDDLGEALETISGLRVHPFWSQRITPPAVVVQWPENVEFDVTYRRGGDRVTFPVSVLAGLVDARSTRDRLARFADGAGPDSIKQAIERSSAPSYHSAHVSRVDFEMISVAGVDYMAATFDVDVIGSGGK